LITGPILATQDDLGAVKVLKDINRGFIYDGPLMVLIDEVLLHLKLFAAVLQDYQKQLWLEFQVLSKSNESTGLAFRSGSYGIRRIPGKSGLWICKYRGRFCIV
jgi:hypothetical protein